MNTEHAHVFLLRVAARSANMLCYSSSLGGESQRTKATRLCRQSLVASTRGEVWRPTPKTFEEVHSNFLKQNTPPPPPAPPPAPQYPRCLTKRRRGRLQPSVGRALLRRYRALSAISGQRLKKEERKEVRRDCRRDKARVNKERP